MKNNYNWNKCNDIIHRLSSRINNEQNQSAMIDYCQTTVPVCIEKTFYQLKNNLGESCCVEMCDDQINSFNFHQPQFIKSTIFDHKNEYIDYIVMNVLRQVVNHIPFNKLYQLSCCLPRDIEKILCHTDMDSDRLIRMLVSDILQTCDTNTRQITDWYAFANLIKPILPTDNDNMKQIDERNIRISTTTSRNLSKQEKSFERISKNPSVISSITTPISSTIPNQQSNETIAFNEIDSPSMDIRLSPIPTSQTASTMDSLSPESIQSKEKFTPVGAKYQSKTRSIQNSISSKNNKINSSISLPFHEQSIKSPTSNYILPDPSIHNSKFSKISESSPSSSSDCIVTVHHKHKHKRTGNHSTITSIDKSASRSISLSNPAFSNEQIIQKNRENSIRTKESKPSELFKLLSTSDNAIKYQHEMKNLCFEETLNDEQSISDEINDITNSLGNSEKEFGSSNQPIETMTRINHYPNMLADFD